MAAPSSGRPGCVPRWTLPHSAPQAPDDVETKPFHLIRRPALVRSNRRGLVVGIPGRCRNLHRYHTSFIFPNADGDLNIRPRT